MKKSRLRGLEKAVGKLGGGRCRICGRGPRDPVQPLIVQSREEANCRQQQCAVCHSVQPVVIARRLPHDPTMIAPAKNQLRRPGGSYARSYN